MAWINNAQEKEVVEVMVEACDLVRDATDMM